jgi:hypothetical protein
MIEASAGVLSPQAWCANKGRDYQEQMTQIAEHVVAYPEIPWPPSPPKQAGQATEEFPPPVTTAPASGGDKTGSEKRAAQKKNG